MGAEIESMNIMVGNQSTTILSKNSSHHNKTKHIDTLPFHVRLH